MCITEGQIVKRLRLCLTNIHCLTLNAYIMTSKDTKMISFLFFLSSGSVAEANVLYRYLFYQLDIRFCKDPF